MTTLVTSGQILLRQVKVIEIVFLNFLTLYALLLSFCAYQEESTFFMQYSGIQQREDGER